MTSKELGELLRADTGQFFSVEFVKRTTGELRFMNCRTGVRKYVKGVGASYDFKEKNLVCVYDMVNKGYRTIPLENVLRVKLHGKGWVDILEENNDVCN